MTTLQDILEPSGKSGPIEDPKPVEQAPQEEAKTQEPAQTNEQQPEPTEESAPEDAGNKTVPLSKHIEMRQKRRDAEERARKYELELARLQGAQSAQQQQQQQSQQAFDPDVFNDQFLENPYQAIQQAKAEAKFETKVEICQDFMRSQHSDYDDMEAKFVVAAQADPSLRMQMLQAANPARFAYEYAKNKEHIGKYKSYEEMEQAIAEKVRKEVEEEMEKKQQGDLIDSVPQSQASAQGGGNTTTQAQDSFSLADILPTKEFS